MRKIKEVEVNGYYFTNTPNLFWHSDKFWYMDNEVKEVYNNGSKSLLLYGSSKVGIKKLRKFAVKCKVKIYIEPLPF